MVSLFRYPKRRLKKLLKEGEYEDALAFGKSLETKFSDDADFMFIMGGAFFIVQDAKNALPYFEKAIQLGGIDVETLKLKTDTHLALEQKDEAIDCCYQILKLDPKNDDAKELIKKLESI